MISQDKEVAGRNFPPADVVKAAGEQNCHGISYTYTEPTIYMEYAYDTAKIAHQVGFFNTFVTNGYMTPEAVRTIAPYLDAATVDFKAGGDPEFYKSVSAVPKVEPIYESLKELKRNGIHIEITNLVVPKMGDSLERIREMATWIKDVLGRDTPFHLLRFHPDYKMTTIPATSIETMEKAYMTAKEAGLPYTYMGNVPGHPAESTYCPNCNEPVIKRHSFEITKWNLTKDMRCPVCGTNIPIKGRLHPSGASFPYALF
jgi:pyruvate formate lyase activating enzyme